MKSTYYLTYWKTALLIAQVSFYLSGATIAYAGGGSTLSLDVLSARHLNNRNELPQGYLEVYSGTEQFQDGGLSYYAHSSYAIYTVDGKLFKRVENHISASDEVPEIVSLPVGSYIVEARSENDGYVRIPITIKKDTERVSIWILDNRQHSNGHNTTKNTQTEQLHLKSNSKRQTVRNLTKNT